jgi:hypothetical protein
MSIFASRTRKVLELPMDPPHTVTIQKLTGHQLAKAAERQMITSQQYLREMGGPQAFKDTLQAALETVSPHDMTADPLGAFDMPTILRAGIVAWDYLEEDGATPLAVSDAAVDDLGAEAADFLAREILRLTKPALFLPAAAREADQKNG